MKTYSDKRKNARVFFVSVKGGVKVTEQVRPPKDHESRGKVPSGATSLGAIRCQVPIHGTGCHKH